MSKFKHNKKRNTAFLYETIIRELSKATIESNETLQKTLVSLLKEFFGRRQILGRELSLYQSILNTKKTDRNAAEKIMMLAQREYERLPQEKIFQAQSTLNFKLKKLFPDGKIFNNFIPQYKSLASLSQIFSKNTNIASRVLLENEFIELMTNELLKEEKIVEPIDALVVKSFSKNFNEEYGMLLEEQKTLLNKYIMSFLDDVELKLFLNEEITRLKTELNQAHEKEQNEENKSSFKEIVKLLEGFSKQNVNEEVIEVVLKTQELIKELKTE